MNILVFNCGSSSLKYRLLAMPQERELAGGEAQRVGPPTAEPSRIVHRSGTERSEHVVPMPDHASAFEQVMRVLRETGGGAPDAVGHRMVHGGTRFAGHALVDPATVEALEAIQGLAPLHNPPATRLVRVCRERYPDLPQVVVFDTAYHSTIPASAASYPLPRELVERWGLRKAGFHGTSHQFVAAEAASMLGIAPDSLDAVSCHLGSGGASLCAIREGRSVENTMGYSPLPGLVMSTRAGDLDPAVALRLLADAGGDGAHVENLLNRRSGVLGLSGLSADLRDVMAAAARERGRAARLDMTLQVYLWRLRQYLGAYLTLVGTPRAIIFTDTIGESLPDVRRLVCSNLGAFGVRLDFRRNAEVREGPADVAAATSAVRVLVITTNEELAIARAAWCRVVPQQGGRQAA